MRSISLTVGFGDYDHTRDLADGRVSVAGAALDCAVVPRPEELFERFLEGGEFDAAELSLAVVTTLRGRSDDRFVAIPVFPARSFRHGAIYVRADGPTSPTELDGATIGIPVWAQTAGVYVRGMLASHYGVRLDTVRWLQAGVDTPGRREPVDVEYGRFQVEPAPDRSLDQMLLDGTVDAVISARPPACIERNDRRVRRLFEDPVAEEAAFFRGTGIFPIMHVLVLRRPVYERHTGIARALFDAFAEAKERSLDRAAATTVPSFPLPWVASAAREARELLGDDWWPYGIAANRASLDAFTGYAAAQGLTPRKLAPEELFAPEFTLDRD